MDENKSEIKNQENNEDLVPILEEEQKDIHSFSNSRNKVKKMRDHMTNYVVDTSHT